MVGVFLHQSSSIKSIGIFMEYFLISDVMTLILDINGPDAKKLRGFKFEGASNESFNGNESQAKLQGGLEESIVSHKNNNSLIFPADVKIQLEKSSSSSNFAKESQSESERNSDRNPYDKLIRTEDERSRPYR